jgi:WD40 repeat protein
MNRSGTWIAGALGVGVLGLGLWWLTGGAELANLRGHAGVIRALVYSPDGALLVSGGDDSIISVWDANTFGRKFHLEGHTGKITSLSVSGMILASASEDQTVRLWDLSSGTEIKRLSGAKKSLDCVALSPDGTLVAAGGIDESIHLWSLPDGKALKPLAGHKKRILTLCFSPDGKTLASAGEEGEIKLWEMPSGKSAGTIPVGIHRVHQLAFAPNGKALSCAIVGSGVRTWDWPGKQEQPKFDGAGQARGLGFDSSGDYFATAHEDGSVKLWSVAERKPVETYLGHDGTVLVAALSPDGKRIASAGADRKVKLWAAKGK